MVRDGRWRARTPLINAFARRCPPALFTRQCSPQDDSIRHTPPPPPFLKNVERRVHSRPTKPWNSYPSLPFRKYIRFKKKRKGKERIYIFFNYDNWFSSTKPILKLIPLSHFESFHFENIFALKKKKRKRNNVYIFFNYDNWCNKLSRDMKTYFTLFKNVITLPSRQCKNEGFDNRFLRKN